MHLFGVPAGSDKNKSKKQELSEGDHDRDSRDHAMPSSTQSAPNSSHLSVVHSIPYSLFPYLGLFCDNIWVICLLGREGSEGK